MKHYWGLFAAMVVAAAAITIGLRWTLISIVTMDHEMSQEASVEIMDEEPGYVVVPDEDEDALITEALLEQGYLRDDVPLSYIEQDYLRTACEEFGVEYELMLALIERETNFRNIPGDGGDSAGYMQIQERWWRDLMEEIGAEDLMDPYDNFRTGCAIVAQLTERYGNIADALTAYNRGTPGDSEYSRAVMAGAEKWRK